MTTTEPQTIQDYINTIAERLDALRQGPCPGRYHHVCEDHPQNKWFCLDNDNNPLRDCGGTGTITDPSYQAAWEVLTRDHRFLRNGLGGRVSGCQLGVSGPIDVVDWPEGAVRGLLEQVVDALWTWDTLPMAFDPTETGVQCQYIGGHFRWGGDAQSLGKAILETLNEQR